MYTSVMSGRTHKERAQMASASRHRTRGTRIRHVDPLGTEGVMRGPRPSNHAAPQNRWPLQTTQVSCGAVWCHVRAPSGPPQPPSKHTKGPIPPPTQKHPHSAAARSTGAPQTLPHPHLNSMNKGPAPRAMPSTGGGAPPPGVHPRLTLSKFKVLKGFFILEFPGTEFVDLDGLVAFWHSTENLFRPCLMKTT